MKGRAESSECVMIRICALMNRHRLSKKQDAHGLGTPMLHFFKSELDLQANVMGGLCTSL